jgi:hypothetical protein
MPILWDDTDGKGKLQRIVVCPECRDELRGIINRANDGDSKAKNALRHERPEFQEPIFRPCLEDWDDEDEELDDSEGEI